MEKNHASTSTDFLLFDSGPNLEMPPSFDQSLQRKLMKKLSDLKIFFKSCLSLLNDKDALAKISTLIEEPYTSLRLEKNVNHVHRRLKTSRELCMNA